MIQAPIVDDVSANLDLFGRTLKGPRCVETSSGNGSEALNKALKSPPDLVMTDLLMPVMDGFSICLQGRTPVRYREHPPGDLYFHPYRFRE